MSSLENLLKYFPKLHGEHGVDATLHELAIRYPSNKIHEVFSNPPGASWNRFDILRPLTGEVFQWDHMPRVPPYARRPDLVLQFNEDFEMSFLLFESKQDIADVYPNMGELLENFFIGSKGYVGIIDRPAWHYKRTAEDEWRVLDPRDDERLRYWFKRYDRAHVHFWSGFAFALNPEYYDDYQKVQVKIIQEAMSELIRTNPKLDVAVAVGWEGEYHFPFILKEYSPDFRRTSFASHLDDLLSPCVREQ